MSDLLFGQPQQTGPGIAFGEGGSNSGVIDAQPRTTRVAPVSGLGLQFGASLAPNAAPKQQQLLDFGAQVAEQQGIAFASTEEGQKKLAEMKSRGALYTPQANNYADLFAIGNQKPSEEQQAKINRLQRLEESLMRQQVLAPQMQVDPVGTRAAIATLRAELDNDTRNLRVYKEKHDFAMKQNAQIKAAREEGNQQVIEQLDKLPDAQLKDALINNNVSKLHPGASNLLVMGLLEQRSKMDLSVGEDGKALSPEDRAQKLTQTLDGLPLEDLQAMQQFVKQAGVTAYAKRDIAAKLKQSGTMDVDAIAKEDELDRRHNALQEQMNKRTGNLQPNEVELLDAIVRRQERYKQTGKSPSAIAFQEEQMRALGNMRMSIFEERSAALAKMGAALDPELNLSIRRRIAEGERLAANATDDKERRAILDFNSKVDSEIAKYFDDHAEALTSDAAIKPALKNYLATGSVLSAADGGALLANRQWHGQTGYTQRVYEFKTIDAAGTQQSTFVPLASPAAAAEAALKPAVDGAIKLAETTADPALKLQYERAKKENKGKDVGLLTGDRDESVLRRAYQGLTIEQKAGARLAYNDALNHGTLIMLLNEHIGNDLQSKGLQDKLVDAQPNGSAFRKELLVKDAKTGLMVLDTANIAAVLHKAGRLDVLGKMIADLENADRRRELAKTLLPDTMREKALFALLNGNDSFAMLSPTQANIAGRQTPASHIEGRIFNPLLQTLKSTAKALETAESMRTGVGAANPTIGDIFAADTQSLGNVAAPGSYDKIVNDAAAARRALLGGGPK